MITNGSSTGRAPIHVNKKNVITKIQNNLCFFILN